MQIDRQQLMEVETFHFVAEASSLELPVGRFPSQLETQIGNGQPFILTSRDECCHKYRQQLGCCTITIFND